MQDTEQTTTMQNM